MAKIMETSFGPKFDELRARYARNPEEKEEYEREVRRVMFIRKLLMAIDAQRESIGLSKAELARRIGSDPSIVRRIFTSETANPTLKTVVNMLTALNIDVELRPTQPPAPTPEKPSRKSRKALAA